MRIGIDARFFSEAGIGRYIRNLINNLARIDQKNDYFIFLLDKDFNEVKPPENFQKVKANFGWYGLQEQLRLPRLLESYGLDLVHFPHFNVPIFYKGKFVVTIHDLIHQNFQMKRATTHNKLVYKLKQYGYEKVFKTAVNKSEHILVPSEYVKKLLVNGWKVADSKITVTKEAVDDKIFTNNKIAKPAYEYIFYVGNAHPHKNVEGLIKAFLLLKEQYHDLRLVLAGYDHYFWQKIKGEYQDESIIYKGYVNDEQLSYLYKGAKAFVMPSFDEGFGLPVLEAFAVGVPIVASNAGSLPEVGGNACVYFNSKDPQDMADKIQQVLNSGQLRNELIKKGKERVKLFSWKKLTKKTLQIYESCNRS